MAPPTRGSAGASSWTARPCRWLGGQWRTINGQIKQGAVFGFVWGGSSWINYGYVTGADSTNGDAFGNAIAGSGTDYIVGAWGDDANRGSAHVFSSLSLTERVVVGLGPSTQAGGWMAIRSGLPAVAHLAWRQVQWPEYTLTGGGTHPATGDLDGDGLDELVVGFGPGGGGWLEVFDDSAAAYRHLRWLTVPWPLYNTASGETHPAAGDLDGDAWAEIVVGLGAYVGNDGWFAVMAGGEAGYPFLGWRTVNWPQFQANGGPGFPAVGRLR